MPISNAPLHWPKLSKWVSISRRNAIDLFPRSTYEDYRVSRRLLYQKLSVISRPETILSVCGTDSHRFSLTNLQKRVLSPSLGNGLILAEGDDWKEQRRLANKLSARPRLSQRINLDHAHLRLDNMIDNWLSSKGSPDRQKIHEDLLKVSIEMLAATLFGTTGVSATDDMLDTISAHREAIENFDILDAMGAPTWLRSQKMRRAHRISQRYNDLILTHLKSVGIFQELGSDDRIRDFAVSMMTGFESIANTSLWAIGQLARTSPEAQVAMVESEPDEVKLLQWSKPIKSPLDALIAETLRLYPPLPLIYRKARDRYRTVDGSFEKGEILCISPWIVHRHTKLWENPVEFRPERWLEKTPDEIPGYIPFGVGSRQCVGRYIGPALIRIILTRCIRRTRFKIAEAPSTVPRAGVTLRPLKPLAICALPREAAANNCAY